MTVREQCKGYMERTGTSGNAIAKAIDWAGGTFNLWLREDYTGDNAAIERDVAAYLSRMDLRQKVKVDSGFVPTRQGLAMLATLRYAHARGKMGLVIGSSGSGKTKAIEHYVATQSGVIWLTIDEVSKSPSAVLHDLAEAIGLKTRGTLRGILRALIKELTGSKRLIVVDEAQELTHDAIGVLRKIYDTAKVGVVFSGMPRLYYHMIGNGVELFEQIKNRIAIKKELPLLNVEDATKILHSFDPSISAETCHVAHQLSHSCGRRLVMLYEQAALEAADEGRSVTAEDFIAAQEFLYEEAPAAPQKQPAPIVKARPEVKAIVQTKSNGAAHATAKTRVG